MESQPQNPEFRINPENFHPCSSLNYREVYIKYFITQSSIYGVIVYFLLFHESLNYSTGQ